jgi:2,3-dihydroxybenzoate decarboxylase
MIIDFQHHYLPKLLWEKHGGRPGREIVWYERGVRKLGLRDLDHQIEKHLDAMDNAGIDAAVLTSWEPSLGDAKFLNNDLAELQRKYPKRIIGFAHTPPLGGKKALQELERGIKDLGLRGVAITGHVHGRSLDSEELFPFYEKVSALDVPIFVHASTIPPFPILKGAPHLVSGIGRELDLALATCRLIYGGVLEKFSNLKFVIGHLGGGIGGIKERFTLMSRQLPAGSRMKRDFGYYFDKLYFDSAGFVDGTNAIRASLCGMKASQIVLGTDFPHGGMTGSRMLQYMRNIKVLPIPKADIHAILAGNATRLLKL